MLVEEGKLEATKQESGDTYVEELCGNFWNNCDPLLLGEKFAEETSYKKKYSASVVPVP